MNVSIIIFTGNELGESTLKSVKEAMKTNKSLTELTLWSDEHQRFDSKTKREILHRNVINRRTLWKGSGQ